MLRLGLLTRLLATSAGVLGGCAQLAGIDETTGIDPPGPGVSLSFERISVGATIVRAPLDLTGYSASYLIADDLDPSGLVRVPAMQSAVDRWSAPLEGTPPILFDLPDQPLPLSRIWELPVANSKGLFGVMEHPNPEPAPPGATLAVNVTLNPPYNGEGLQIYTLGSWNVRGLEAPPLGATTLAPPPFAMTSMTSITGRPHEKLTTADAVLILRYVGNQLVGALDAASFDQTGTDTITGTVAPVALTKTLDARIDQAAAAMRYSAARPAVSNLSMSWSIRAAPGYEIANDNGPLLHALGVLPTDPTTITATYGNPFGRNWRSVLTWGTGESRVYTPPAAGLPVTLQAGMFQRAEPTPGIVLDLPAGLPELISIDGRSLSTDGSTFPAPSTAVEITFATDRPSNTLYQMQLFKLVPNNQGMAPTALEYKVVIESVGLAPRFTLPREVFEVGGLYTIRAITTLGGHPTIATGDLRNRELPIAISYLDSGVFEVVAQ